MSPDDPGRTGPSLLVCVYYRVAAADARAAIRAVREFQRTLHGRVGVTEAEVLLRFGLPSSGAPPDPVSLRSSASVSEAAAAPDADATLMETYRLGLPAPAGSPHADASVAAFLAVLDAGAAPLAALLRGPRHVELFAPCAS